MSRRITRKNKPYRSKTKKNSNNNGITFHVSGFDFGVKETKNEAQDGAARAPLSSREQEADQAHCFDFHKPRTIMAAASQGDIRAFMDIFYCEKSNATGNPDKAQRLQNQLNCALVQAVTSRNVKLVTAILDLGADTDAHWYPVTNYVVNSGSEEILDVFISRGISFKATSGEGSEKQRECSVLHQAARTGNPSILSKLLKLSELNVNSLSPTSGQTPLHVAAQYNKNLCANLLIEAGADITIVDSKGKSALHEAAGYGNITLLKRLLDLGTNPNAIDSEGKNAWFYALNHGHIRSADLIMKHMDKNHFETQLQNGRNYLHLAANQGNPNITKKLLELGCDPAARDSDGNTPLMHIVTSNIISGFNLKVLLGHPRVTEILNTKNNDGETALSLVFKNSSFDIQQEMAANALLKAGADVNLTYSENKTLLMKYVNHRNKLTYLVTHGAVINHVSHNGMNVFWAVCREGRGRNDVLTTLKTLIENNADVRLCAIRCSPSDTSAFTEVLRSGDVPSASLMYHAGCSLRGVGQWLKTEEAQETLRRSPETSNFITQLQASGRLTIPQSLWDQARLAILPALGPSDIKDKVHKLGLPPSMANLLKPENYEAWHKTEQSTTSDSNNE